MKQLRHRERRVLERPSGTARRALLRGPGAQPLERHADLAPRRPNPRPQIDQRRVLARRAVEGAHTQANLPGLDLALASWPRLGELS